MGDIKPNAVAVLRVGDFGFSVLLIVKFDFVCLEWDVCGKDFSQRNSSFGKPVAVPFEMKPRRARDLVIAQRSFLWTVRDGD